MLADITPSTATSFGGIKNIPFQRMVAGATTVTITTPSMGTSDTPTQTLFQIDESLFAVFTGNEARVFDGEGVAGSVATLPSDVLHVHQYDNAPYAFLIFYTNGLVEKRTILGSSKAVGAGVTMLANFMANAVYFATALHPLVAIHVDTLNNQVVILAHKINELTFEALLFSLTLTSLIYTNRNALTITGMGSGTTGEGTAAKIGVDNTDRRGLFVAASNDSGMKTVCAKFTYTLSAITVVDAKQASNGSAADKYSVRLDAECASVTSFFASSGFGNRVDFYTESSVLQADNTTLDFRFVSTVNTPKQYVAIKNSVYSMAGSAMSKESVPIYSPAFTTLTQAVGTVFDAMAFNNGEGIIFHEANRVRIVYL